MSDFKSAVISSNTVGLPPVYWINMKRSKERRKNMESTFLQFPHLKTVRIDAIDGKKVDASTLCTEFSRKQPSGKLASNSELCCTLSHLTAIKQAFEAGESSILVMEDDCTFEFIPQWPSSFDELISTAPKDCRILQLAIIVPQKHRTVLEKHKENKQMWTKHLPYYYSTAAYYINRKGMQEIISKHWNDTLNKFVFNSGKYHVADFLIYGLEGVYTITTPLFGYKAEDSTIHNNHSSSHADSLRWIRTSLYGKQERCTSN